MMRIKTTGISEFFQQQFIRLAQGIAAFLVLILITATVQEILPVDYREMHSHSEPV